jgi:uncharacterized membrane protein
MDNNNKSNKTLMAILAYIGPFILVSYLVSKDDPFVKFHIKQGLILVVAWLIMWFLGHMFWGLWSLWYLVQLAILVLAVIGIVNAAQGKENALPLVGHLGDKFKI